MRGAKDDSKEVGLRSWMKGIDIFRDMKDWRGAGWGRKSVGVKIKRLKKKKLICKYLLDF